MMKVKAEWLTALCTLIIAGTGVWALVYASGQIRQMREETQRARDEARIQHLLLFDDEYRKEPMVTYRRSYAKQRLHGVEDPYEAYEVLDFFEGIALLTKKEYLSETDVWEMFGGDILSVWADERDFIEQGQKSDPSAYSNLSQLIPQLEAIDAAHHGTAVKPSKEDLHDYWEKESRVGVGTPLSENKHSKPTTSPALTH